MNEEYGRMFQYVFIWYFLKSSATDLFFVDQYLSDLWITQQWIADNRSINIWKKDLSFSFMEISIGFLAAACMHSELSWKEKVQNIECDVISSIDPHTWIFQIFFFSESDREPNEFSTIIRYQYSIFLNLMGHGNWI